MQKIYDYYFSSPVRIRGNAERKPLEDNEADYLYATIMNALVELPSVKEAIEKIAETKVAQANWEAAKPSLF